MAHEAEPALISIKIKLTKLCTVEVAVRDPSETSSSIADRVLRNAELVLPMPVKRKLVATIEAEVNKKIESLIRVVKRHNSRLLKEQRQREHKMRQEAIQNLNPP